MRAFSNWALSKLHHYLFEQGPDLATAPVWRAVNDFLLKGWFGVQLFFVISGFILAMPFAEQHLSRGRPVSLKNYFIRRLTRLEPPYLINLLVVMGLLMWDVGRDGAGLLRPLLHSATYTHNLFYQRGSLINEVAWSLEIEVQFYILAPVLCLVFKLGRAWLRRAVLAGAVLLLCVREQYDGQLVAWLSACLHRPLVPGILGLTLVGQLKYFLLGLLLAEVYLVHWRSMPTKKWSWDALGLAAWALVPACLYSWPLAGAWDGSVQRYILPAAMLVAYMAAFRGPWLNKFFAYPWVAAVGGMCYTIYLYHNWCLIFCGRFLREPVQRALLDWGAPFALRFSLDVLMLALPSLVLCSFLFLLFEKPFMRKDWPARWRAGLARLLSGTRSDVSAATPPALAEPEPVGEVEQNPRQTRLEEVAK